MKPNLNKTYIEVLSLVVPCFNEEEALPRFYAEVLRVTQTLKEVDLELVLIDDGSRDGTLQVMRDLASKDARVHYLSFSRNFGKESAILAGLRASKGDYVALMDADLQDPPDLLPFMYHAVVSEGYDNAAARRVSRKGEPKIRSFFARLFYKVINRLSQTEIVDGARDFRLMRRSMVDAILEMPEYNRFSKGIFGWVGFNTKWFEYENVERVAGTTKWSFWKLCQYSIEGIVAFSTAPLALASVMGIMFCFLAFLLIAFIVVRTVLYKDPVAGWPSLVCLITFIGGVQLLSTGIMGQYLAKIYLETKSRPSYLIKEDSRKES
jgi:glycosyltransferase involved in cell wall biosynthesis